MKASASSPDVPLNVGGLTALSNAAAIGNGAGTGGAAGAGGGGGGGAGTTAGKISTAGVGAGASGTNNDLMSISNFGDWGGDLYCGDFGDCGNSGDDGNVNVFDVVGGD